VLMGALLGTLMTRNLAPGTLDSWGWRVPFLFGLIIGPLGLFIRSYLEETAAFLETSQKPDEWPPLGVAVASQIKEILVCMGIVIAGTISFYIVLLYMPTFARTQLHIPLDQAFLAQAIGLACEIVFIPIFGALPITLDANRS
jgi:MFS transporter, MHS family, proline/betaine transporter